MDNLLEFIRHRVLNIAKALKSTQIAGFSRKSAKSKKHHKYFLLSISIEKSLLWIRAVLVCTAHFPRQARKPSHRYTLYHVTTTVHSGQFVVRPKKFGMRQFVRRVIRILNQLSVANFSEPGTWQGNMASLFAASASLRLSLLVVTCICDLVIVIDNAERQSLESLLRLLRSHPRQTQSP